MPSSPAPSAGAPVAAAPAAKPTPEGPGSDSDAEQAGQAALELAERFRDAVVRGERLSRAVQLVAQPPALHHGRHVPSQLGWFASGALTLAVFSSIVWQEGGCQHPQARRLSWMPPILPVGAKATADGVELFVQWADGTSGRVPTSM